MRIWDINPGYLNRQSLLGEHRELHGLVNILTLGKKGYSRHPETLRWVGFGWALKQRHDALAAEMTLRGYHDYTPVRTRSGSGHWPSSFIDSPGDQLKRLQQKYQEKEPGRIPLPNSPQQLWSQHKYSVMARDIGLYKSIGHRAARMAAGTDITPLALELTLILRTAPSAGGTLNALQHMWGYVSKAAPASAAIKSWSAQRLLSEIQDLAIRSDQRYLLHSTALGELAVHTRKP